MNQEKQRLIIGISGASGIIYAIRLLESLKETPIETHLVISKAGQLTLSQETDYKLAEVTDLADVHHPIGDVGASIASGSYKTLGMVVLPCSIKSMSEIACGMTSNLLTRAADVVLKERRKLVLSVRETPLHLGHLRNMTQLAELGAMIMPPMPAFYPKPESIDQLVDHHVGRILDMFDIPTDLVDRWEGLQKWGIGNNDKSVVKRLNL